MAVELADLDLSSRCGMGDIDAGESDFRKIGDLALVTSDSGAADMDAVAMVDRILGINFEPDELPLGCACRSTSAARPINRHSSC